MRFPYLATFVLVAPFILIQPAASADEVDDLLTQAKNLVNQGKLDEALQVAGKAIATDPKNIKGYFFRATVYVGQHKAAKAVADYDRIIALDPKLALAYDLRGSEHFKLGHIKRSIADFDKFIELKPKEKNGHWRRGIAYYYAGKFKEGRDQFKGYESVDTNDVENAVWHFLCVARDAGLATARKSMLKIGKDPRVPLMEVYALYLGKAKPADVMAAADQVPKDAPANLLKQQRFYAHLYLGLYYDATGDRKKALEEMKKAVALASVGGYMGDVARVHLAVIGKGNRGQSN